MRLIDDLLASAPAGDAAVRRVVVGLHWTVVESRSVGMAHTPRPGPGAEIRDSGSLVGRGARKLAERLRRWEPLEAALGLAALNSLLEPNGTPGNAVGEVARLARGATVTVVGRFPFARRLAGCAGRLHVLEIEPEGDELPAWAAEEVVPASDLVVITATALINKTLPRLLELARGATAVVLGPTTPMNDVLLRHGAALLGGVRVVDPDALFRCAMEGSKRFDRLAGVEPIVLRK